MYLELLGKESISLWLRSAKSLDWVVVLELKDSGDRDLWLEPFLDTASKNIFVDFRVELVAIPGRELGEKDDFLSAISNSKVK